MTDRLAVQERIELGKAARDTTPREAHAELPTPADRPNVVDTLLRQETTRVPWLLPERHKRMGVSPFTFYRGCAAQMSADLAVTPTTGLLVQAGGDAHLSNFGAYASPSRELVVDQNDFDETLPGPWEWDVKRLAASFVIAAEHLGFPDAAARKVARTSVSAYRKGVAMHAEEPALTTWYDTLTVHRVAEMRGLDRAEFEKRVRRFTEKAQSRTSLQAMKKLTDFHDGRLQFRSQPPVLIPLRDLPEGAAVENPETIARTAFEAYVTTLPDHMKVLISRYEIVDIAVKVVGVGSVGTRCFVILLIGRDESDPLMLQVKEADRSVLEPYTNPSLYDNQGERVVQGQRLSQAQSDIFLGWTKGPTGVDLYVRQLRDWKGSIEVEEGTVEQLGFYAGLCGLILARAHARSGDAIAISSYMGKGSTFDKAVAEFSMLYRERNQADFEEFQRGLTDGRLVS